MDENININSKEKGGESGVRVCVCVYMCGCVCETVFLKLIINPFMRYRGFHKVFPQRQLSWARRLSAHLRWSRGTFERAAAVDDRTFFLAPSLPIFRNYNRVATTVAAVFDKFSNQFALDETCDNVLPLCALFVFFVCFPACRACLLFRWRRRCCAF